MNTILIKRVNHMIQKNNSLPEDLNIIDDLSLNNRFNVAINDRSMNNINKDSHLLSTSTEQFYRNNIEKNQDALVKFNAITIENSNNALDFKGLYFHKNGHLVFLLSTFNDTNISKNIINFYKMKIQLILDFCRLKQCYVYRFYYDKISRNDYLRLKRNNYCLWTAELNKDNYCRITNFEHDIILSQEGIKERFFPETIVKISRKRRLSEDESTSTKRNKLNINWREWVSASRVRNFMINDPLLDWLEEYNITSIFDRPDRIGGNSSVGRSMFKQDNEFITLIKNQGLEFENLVLKDLKRKYNNNVVQVAESFQARDLSKVNKTFELMKEGVPILYQPVLHNDENKTYGCPDFLVRSDWLTKIFNDENLNSDDLKIKATNLNGNYHYTVVDVKCSTLHLNSNGITLRNQGSIPAYKAQILIYNIALGKLQGYFPTKAYILGKKWNYTSKRVHFSGNNCYDKAGVIDYSDNDSIYLEKVENALDWIRDVRNQGHSWTLLPTPSRPELYPNMCNEMDGNWKKLKSELAEKLDEITMIWMCGPKNRNIAFSNDVYKWTEDECTSETLGFKGEVVPKVLDQILTVNRSDSIKILPRKIQMNFKDWQKEVPLEFFIDFETMTSIFTPLKVGNNDNVGHDTENYIFMIGLGHIDPITKKWVYKDFTVNQVNADEEIRIIDEMWAHINSLCSQHIPNKPLPNFYHWSHAEPTCYRKAVNRHGNRWRYINFCDMLTVFKKEPITIKGALNFGLKSVAKALYHNKMIEVIWDNENPCSNGLSAMVLAWKTYQRNILSDVHESPVIQDIIKYNEIDCRVLWEIINYLRKNHT